MSKPFLIAFATAVAAIGVLVWVGLEKTAGNHLVPTGSIGKVRTIQTGDDTTFMVVDFNVTNDSDRDMVVRSVESTVDAADGSTITGGTVAAADVATVFQAYPILGEQYNQVLKERDTIPPRHTVDRMVGIRLDAPLAKVDGRKRVRLRIEDITGPVLELTK